MASRLHSRLIKTEHQASRLQHLTYDIQMGQASQVGTMLGWLQMWNESPNGTLDMAHLGMRTPDEVQSLSALPETQAKVKFLQYMVTHHQGGVTMAEGALKEARTTEVRGFAGKIIQAQSSEIETMTRMLRDLGAKPLPPVQRAGHP